MSSLASSDALPDKTTGLTQLALLLAEAWRDLQYIGDFKAGKFMGKDE